MASGGERDKRHHDQGHGARFGNRIASRSVAGGEVGLPDEKVIAVDHAIAIGIAIGLRRTLGRREVGLPGEKIIAIDGTVFVEIARREIRPTASLQNGLPTGQRSLLPGAP